MKALRSKASLHAFYADAVGRGRDTPEGLRSPTSARFDRFLPAIGSATPRTALDLGYGMGAYSIALARAGFRVVAVDQVPGTPFLQRLRDQGDPASRVEVVEGLIEQHPIDAGLGVLVAKDVLHYLAREDIEAVLGRAVRSSHPHGFHYLEVFTDISRTAADGRVQRIEGEADLSAESFGRLLGRVYQGWDVSLSWDAHAEQDSRTGRNYFEAIRATVIAARHTTTRKDAG